MPSLFHNCFPQAYLMLHPSLSATPHLLTLQIIHQMAPLLALLALLAAIATPSALGFHPHGDKVVPVTYPVRARSGMGMNTAQASVGVA